MKMKNFKFAPYVFMSLCVAILAISSCGDDNEIISLDEDDLDSLDDAGVDPFDARINNNTTDSLDASLFLSDVEDSVIDVLLTFTSEDENMDRLYVTVNSQGQGEEVVDAGDAFGASEKGDGSFDLDGDIRNGFNFDLNISTANLPSEGTVVYTFWATSGKGDHRDIDKRLLIGPATLTIDLEGVNPAKVLREYTEVIKLEAPLADASSETFISTLNGEVYQISEGEEFAAFWDFGFYYLNDDGVSLASTAVYPPLFANPEDPDGDLVTVNEFLGIESTEINNAYFRLAPDGTDFDSFNTVTDLTFEFTASDVEEINQLQIGDIVYIQDQYEKRGILEVTGLVESFGSDGFIEFDLKMER